MSPERERLERLATLYGVESAYIDALGQRRVASDEALFSALRALGSQVVSAGDLDVAIVTRLRETWQRLSDEVAVAWGDRVPSVLMRFPADAGGAVRATLTTEAGEAHTFEARLDALPLVESETVEGQAFEQRRFEFGESLEPGYHKLELLHGHRRAAVTLIVAPKRAPLPANERAWGVFLPLYALRSERSLGIGDTSDLLELIRFVDGLGGDLVGTLPLLSTFLDAPCEGGPVEPSPYAPVSRLFWNELYLDPRACPEFKLSPEAQAIAESDEFGAEVAALRAQPLVDYARQYALLRPLIEALSDTFFAGDTSELDAYEATHGRARDYARFRAAVERHGAPHGFPASMVETLSDDDVDPSRVRYHLFAQMRIDEQLHRAHEAARGLGIGLYLDMPLGVHPDGYDAFRDADSFLSGLSAGAPPDALFTGGQSWGLKPLSPDGLRRTGLRYVRECLAHQMAGAAVLRVDHVMGLHRIYCVPDGFNATEGVYVRMPHEALYAVVLLESHRHGTCLVGEDLGTVPDAVREAMDRHALMRMYVLPFELRPDEAMMLGEIPKDAVASLNTHDMPSFCGWWTGADLEVQRELGLLDEAERAEERRKRESMTRVLAERLGVAHEPAAVFDACLMALATSDSRLVLVNLEDLWSEPDPQNVPGTHRERPNWRRKARLSLEQMRADRRVGDVLEQVNARRKR